MSSSTATRVKDTAKSAATKVESAANEAVNNPKQAKNDFLHLPVVRAALPFVNGGLSGMIATTCIQPIDMIKVRLQLAGEGIRTGPKPSPLSITKDIIAQGKVLDLYTGLSAGLLRQAVYTTARLGFFDTFQNMLTARAEKRGTEISFAERGAAGLTAGGLAAMIGNPADLALIRMQSDGLKPKDQRANYRSVFDALKRITATEGLGALWAGAYPSSPHIAFLMTLVEDLLSCVQHMLQPLFINHVPCLVMAQSTDKHNLEQKLWCSARRSSWILVCHVRSRKNRRT